MTFRTAAIAILIAAFVCLTWYWVDPPLGTQRGTRIYAEAVEAIPATADGPTPVMFVDEPFRHIRAAGLLDLTNYSINRAVRRNGNVWVQIAPEEISHARTPSLQGGRFPETEVEAFRTRQPGRDQLVGGEREGAGREGEDPASLQAHVR